MAAWYRFVRDEALCRRVEDQITREYEHILRERDLALQRVRSALDDSKQVIFKKQRIEAGLRMGTALLLRRLACVRRVCVVWRTWNIAVERGGRTRALRDKLCSAEGALVMLLEAKR